MAFNLISIDRDGIVRIGATGNITWREVQGNDGPPLAAILGPNWAQMRILLDMTQAQFIDSAAVGWLIETQRTLKTAGGRLVLYHVQPTVQQVFDVLRVGRVIAMASDEAGARARASEETPAN